MTTRLMGFIAALALVAAACGAASVDVASIEDTNQSDQELSDVASLGASDSAAEPGDAADDEVDTEAAVLAYTQCLRDEGIDVEDPTVDEEGNMRPPRLFGSDASEVDHQTMQDAREACSEYLGGVTFGFQHEGEGIGQIQRQELLLAYAACLRDEGLEVDDPGTSPGDHGPGGFGSRGILGDNDPSDPKVQDALEACNELLPGAQFGGGAGHEGGEGFGGNAGQEGGEGGDL